MKKPAFGQNNPFSSPEEYVEFCKKQSKLLKRPIAGEEAHRLKKAMMIPEPKIKRIKSVDKP